MKQIMKIRPFLLEFFTHKAAIPIVLCFRKKNRFHYSMEDLEQFPEGTLGKDLVIELKQNNFILLKNYERHDCKHIILEYPMNELGEASMQFYFLGTRHYSFPVLLTVSVCIIIMPDYWSRFYREFRKGRNGKKLNGLNFNELVHESTTELRNKYQAKSI